MHEVIKIRVKPQQNCDQEWNNGRQFSSISTDFFMIMQTLSEALMQRKYVKTQL